MGWKASSRAVKIGILVLFLIAPLTITFVVLQKRARPITVDAPTHPPIFEGNSFEVLKRVCLDTLDVAKRSYEVREAERRFGVGGDPRDKAIEEQSTRQLMPLRIRYVVTLRMPCAPTDAYSPLADTEYLGAIKYWAVLEAILIEQAFDGKTYGEIAACTRNLTSLALAVSKGQGSSHSYGAYLCLSRFVNAMGDRIVNLTPAVARAVAKEIERYETERVTVVQRLEADRACDINFAKLAYEGRLSGTFNDTSLFDRALWNWASEAEAVDAMYKSWIEEVKKPMREISNTGVKKPSSVRLTFAPLPPRFLASADASRMAKLRLLRVACLITAFRAENGRLPNRLDELQTSGIDDPFSDGALKYKVSRSKYVLYSVGPDLKDDGGIQYRGEAKGDIGAAQPLDLRPRTPVPATWLK